MIVLSENFNEVFLFPKEIQKPLVAE